MNGTRFKRALISDWQGEEQCDIIEGPKEIINSLDHYIQGFDRYREENFYGDWSDYDVTEGLVEYLNTVILEGNYPLVKIVERNSTNYDPSYKRINF